MLVAANKELYVTLPKKQKMLLSQSIVNAVRSQNPPGRFLQKDVGGNSSWYDVGDKRAQEKTSQALREGAPEIRTKIHTPTLTSPNPGQAAVPSSSASTTSNSQTSNDQQHNKEVRTLSVSGVPSTPISSAPVVSDVQSNQPPTLTEVTSSSVASAGSSSTQHHANHTTRQQGRSNPLDDIKPIPYNYDQVPPPTHYREPIPTRHDTYSQGYHRKNEPNSQQMHSFTHPQAHRRPPSSYDSYASMAPPSVISATPYPQQGSFVESNANSQQQQISYHNQYHQQENNQRLQKSTSVPCKNNAEAQGNSVPREIDEVFIPTLREPVTSPSQQKECFKYDELPVPTNKKDKEYDNNGFDDIPIVPPPLHGHDFSFGSTIMISELEQARLMDGTSFGTAMSYGYAANQNYDNRNTFNPTGQRDPYIDKHMPLPVDGGLEPVGLSFGSVMSTTTFNEPSKLDGAGMSFGSMMSYAYNNRSTIGTVHSEDAIMPTCVDGGLEEIGTSMGSLTLDPEERRRIIESTKQDMLNEQCDNPEMPPPSFKAAKSRGNLLECSDSEESEEESEVKSQQLIAQKSLEWERMQAALAVHTSTSGTTSHDSNSYNNNNYNRGTYYGMSKAPMYNQPVTFSNDNMTPIALNIPTTTFDRDFSQMSAISVNDDFEKDPSYNNYSRSINHSMSMFNNYTQSHENNTDGESQRNNYVPGHHHHQQQGVQVHRQENESTTFDPLPYQIDQKQQYALPSNSTTYPITGIKSSSDYYNDYNTQSQVHMPPSHLK
jgi:hypothetical protein